MDYDSTLARAIRAEREALRTGRTGNLINARIMLANLALYRRGQPMRSWTYNQVLGAQSSYRQSGI